MMWSIVDLVLFRPDAGLLGAKLDSYWPAMMK